MLDTLKNSRRHFGLVAFGRTIDHPDVVTRAAQLGTHLLETGAVEEARNGDVADHSGELFIGWWLLVAPARALLENLPRSPAPEVDIKVAQMLGMGANLPRLGRLPDPWDLRP